MHDDGRVQPMSVRELATAADFRNAEFQRQTGGLGQLEKRMRQDDRIRVASPGEAVGPSKALPPPICRLGQER